jgi:hypothetical protein
MLARQLNHLDGRASLYSGCLSSLDPPITLTLFHPLIFVLGWVVVWGRGRRGASGRGALTVIPIPVVGNHPTTNFSLQVTNMRKSKIIQGPEPWEDALAPAVSGEPAGKNPAEKKAEERLDKCQRLIEETMRCLGNGNKECIMRKMEELVRANCHDSRLVSKEVADKVRELVHELWLVSDDVFRCELLKMLRSLGVSKR